MGGTEEAVALQWEAAVALQLEAVGAAQPRGPLPLSPHHAHFFSRISARSQKVPPSSSAADLSPTSLGPARLRLRIGTASRWSPRHSCIFGRSPPSLRHGPTSSPPARERLLHFATIVRRPDPHEDQAGCNPATPGRAASLRFGAILRCR